MKTSARILITATTLAALTMLGLAATATATVPMPPRGPQQGTTTVEPTTGPQPGHGAQLHHDAHDTGRATPSQPASDRTTSADSAFAPWIVVLAVTVLGLLVGLAGAIWLGRRHRQQPADRSRPPLSTSDADPFDLHDTESGLAGSRSGESAT